MPLLNDMARCQGEMAHPSNRIKLCTRRYSCARYLERNWCGQNAPHYAYLCEEGDMYIPAEKPNDN